MKGQMHCMLSTLQSAGRSLKKKMHRVSAQMYCVQRSKMASKGYTHSCYFLLQRYRSARQSLVQNDVLGLERQLQIFHFLCLNMAALSFYTHTEVCCKICKQRTIYVRNFQNSRHWSKRRENSSISFPLGYRFKLEINWSLKIDETTGFLTQQISALPHLIG